MKTKIFKTTITSIIIAFILINITEYSITTLAKKDIQTITLSNISNTSKIFSNKFVTYIENIKTQTSHTENLESKIQTNILASTDIKYNPNKEIDNTTIRILEYKNINMTIEKINMNIKKSEALALILKYKGIYLDGKTTKKDICKDVYTHDWHASYIELALSKEWISKNNDNCEPNKLMSQREVIELVNNVYQTEIETKDFSEKTLANYKLLINILTQI